MSTQNVKGLIHSFHVQDAVKYGVNQAILLSNLRHWVAENKANNRNFIGGKWWTYNSSSAFEELFPYMKSSSIRRWLRELEEAGAIESSVQNKEAFDKTKWYTVCDSQSIDQNDQRQPHTVDQNDQPIPDSKHTDINKEIYKGKFDELPPTITASGQTVVLELLLLVVKKKHGRDKVRDGRWVQEARGAIGRLNAEGISMERMIDALYYYRDNECWMTIENGKDLERHLIKVEELRRKKEQGEIVNDPLKEVTDAMRIPQQRPVAPPLPENMR